MQPIIDTHVHIWDLERGHYEWLKGDTSILNRTYSFDALEPYLKEANVTQCVLVQADNALDDTERMLETANVYAQVVGVVGWLPLMNPKETLSLLQEKYLQEPYFKGVRHLIHNEPDPTWLLQANVMESLRILSTYQIPFDVVGTTTEHLNTVLKVAHQLPELRMVLDHLNQPPIVTKERLGKWRELMNEAAQHDNVYCKISGLGTTTGTLQLWTKEDIKPYIMYVLETFGHERCFCGGDWPVSLLAGSFKKIWNAYQSIVKEELSASEQEKVLCGNAQSFYHL